MSLKPLKNIVEDICGNPNPLEYAASLNLQRTLNKTQRAMVAARAARISNLRMTDLAKVFNLSVDSLTNAKYILELGTEQEIRDADNGCLPLIRGRELCRGHDSPRNRKESIMRIGSISSVGASAYQRIANEGAAIKRRPRPLKPVPAPPTTLLPLTFDEIVRALIIYSTEHPKIEEVIKTPPAKLEHLIEWLMEIHQTLEAKV